MAEEREVWVPFGRDEELFDGGHEFRSILGGVAVSCLQCGLLRHAWDEKSICRKGYLTPPAGRRPRQKENQGA